MFDPWTAAASLAGWTIRAAPTPGGGCCDWSTRTITLDPGLTTAQQRAVLTHELVHAARGPFPKWARAREEAQVSAIAARLLVDLPHLVDAVSWSRHPVVLAELLDVDTDTLAARADCLDAAEEAVIAARLENIHLP